MKKPSSCHGCPLYQDGQGGFVPDELRDGAAVFIVGQNPEADEEAEGRPFVGKTGQMMEKYLRDAGLTRDAVSIGNAIRCRWRGGNELPKITENVTKEALRHCWQAHGRIPDGTKLIVAQGDYAAVTLTGGAVGDWRGYLRPYSGYPLSISEPWVPASNELPVLLTVRLARLFREPSLTLPTRLDWAKIPRILGRKWPRRPPHFVSRAPESWPTVFAFDTEYWVEEDAAPTTARLTRWSAAWGTGDRETCVVEAGQMAPTLGARSRVITQYAPADVHHLAALSGTDWRSTIWDQFLIEDTVWKHAVLWSDHAHDLNYLGSIYSSFNRWKHLADTDPVLYSGLDAVGLLEVDRVIEREFDADPRSRSVWETIDRPALGEFVRAQYTGLRTDPKRVKAVLDQADTVAHDAMLRARAIVGWCLSLASNPQVSQRIYEIEGLGSKRSL